jgi:hypothetical protein
VFEKELKRGGQELFLASTSLEANPARESVWGEKNRIQCTHGRAHLHCYAVVLDRYSDAQVVGDVRNEDVDQRQHLTGRQLKSGLGVHDFGGQIFLCD